MIGVNVKLAFESLRSAKLRAFLTMFAVVIGVMLFVVVSAAIEGLKAAAVKDINDLGGNLVTVNSGKLFTDNEDGTRSINFIAAAGLPTLTEKDFKDILEVEGVRTAAPQVFVTNIINRGDQQLESAIVTATTPEYPEAFNKPVEDGSFFSEDFSGRFAVIGQSIKEQLYTGSNPLGTLITIKGLDFTVVGVMAEIKSTIDFGVNLNSSVYISLEDGKELAGGALLMDEIDLQIDEEANPDEVVERLEKKLLENHGGIEDFTVLKQDDLIKLTEDLLGVIDTVAKFMPYVLLFVGGVVILLIMRITVTERTREIGIRKSIGATNGNVLTQFLTESIVISLLGSIFGIGLAYVVGLIVTLTTEFSFVYNLNTLIAVIVIGTIIGALAGFFPSWEAARKDPVEALRHE